MGNFYIADGAAMSSNDDTWTTPRDFYDTLNAEFNFQLDAAAMKSSTLVADNWLGPDHDAVERRDALTANWSDYTNGSVWLNPPYGRTIKGFMAKAHKEAGGGAYSCCACPSPHRYSVVA